jgi:hypothetical protein
MYGMVPMIHETDGWLRSGSADYQHLYMNTWVRCRTVPVQRS